VTGAAQPIRALIVDDEPMARASIRVLLGADPEIAVVGECATGGDAVSAIAALAPELVFLDVQLPRMTGFDVLAAVGERRRFAVVFVTAYDSYALAAFDAQAEDYVLKPFDDDRFQRAVERAKQRIRHTRQGDLAGEPAQTGPGPAPAGSAPERCERIAIRHGARTVFIALSDIDWIEAADYYATLHVGGAAHLVRQTLAELEANLDPRRFVRVHRKAIVNIDRIREIHPLFRGDCTLVLSDGTQVRLSRTRRAEFERLFGTAT